MTISYLNHMTLLTSSRIYTYVMRGIFAIDSFKLCLVAYLTKKIVRSTSTDKSETLCC